MVKYASQLNKENYTFHPGREYQLDWDTLNEMYNDGDGSNQCYLVALDSRQIAFLLAHTSIFPQYHWVWGLPSPRHLWNQQTRDNWDEISAFVAETEHCLMAGCEVQDLVTQLTRIADALEGASATGSTWAIRELTAVIGSQARDFTVPIPDQVDYSQTGITYALYDDQGERLANFLDQIEENLVGINGNLVFINNALSTINTTHNEVFQTQEEGGLPNNINERLRNINIILGGFIDGVDLIGIAESLRELNRIRNTLETTVVTQNGVQRQGIATALQENTDNISFILDRIRDNLDVSIFDDGGEGQIKEYSLTSVLFTRVSEFIEVVDKIRDNLDAVVDADTELSIAGMMDALNITAARMNNSLRCVADALNKVCPPGAEAEPPYLRSGNIETKAPDDDWVAQLQELRDDLINDASEGRAPFEDETDEDYHIADGTFTLIEVEHFPGQDPDTGYLLIDVTTNGKCELIFNVQGLGRTLITSFLTPQEQVYMEHVPDTGTLLVLNEATGDNTSVNW